MILRLDKTIYFSCYDSIMLIGFINFQNFIFYLFLKILLFDITIAIFIIIFDLIIYIIFDKKLFDITIIIKKIIIFTKIIFF